MLSACSARGFRFLIFLQTVFISEKVLINSRTCLTCGLVANAVCQQLGERTGIVASRWALVANAVCPQLQHHGLATTNTTLVQDAINLHPRVSEELTKCPTNVFLLAENISRRVGPFNFLTSTIRLVYAHPLCVLCACCVRCRSFVFLFRDRRKQFAGQKTKS